MVPANLHDFLIACMGASASFIGLLFVGLSVVLARGDQKLANRDRVLAESSYASLINVFFLSLLALVPAATIGNTCFIMAAIGLVSCLHLLKRGSRMSVLYSSAAFTMEGIFGIYYMVHSNAALNTSWFVSIIVSQFAIGLLRAWGLTGIRERSGER